MLRPPITTPKRIPNIRVPTTTREKGRSRPDLEARQGRREDPRQAHPEAERTLTMERSAHARPPLAVDEQHIPRELQQPRQWLVWILEIRDGKPTKVPYCPREPHHRAAVDTPQTWGTFAEAVSAYRKKKTRFSGIGFVFTTSDEFFGIDLGDCRDPHTGAIEPWAQQIIERVRTYTEISPSGTGVHLIGRGTLPPGKRREGHIEIYDDGRYFCVTGRHVEGTPSVVQRCTQLTALHRSVFHSEAQPGVQSSGRSPKENRGDNEVLTKARRAIDGARFRQLWSGDWSRYNS